MTVLPLQQLLDLPKLPSGIAKLDRLLHGSNGFTVGIHDISGAIGYLGLGIHELVFNVMLTALENNSRAVVLYIRTSTTPPWFKLAKNRRFKEEYSSRIKEVTLLTLADLVILVDDDHWWGQYMFVVIDSMTELYSDALDNIKDLGNDVVTRYYKSTRLLFHKLQKIASNKFVFTIGGMKLFNQRVHVQSESVDSDNNDKETPTVKSAIQQILVPIISLKSDLNLYYTNRLIIYRDWVQDNEFGLQSKLTDFTESVVALNKGHMKCVPHYLYIDPAPITPSHSSKSGFFLVDGNGNLLDIDTDDAELQLGDDGMEVINSQEDDDSDVWD